MNDLISRQAAIDWASKIPIHDLSDGRGFCRVIFADDFLKALKTIPLAQSRWIPCSERLPEVNTIVLATTADYMYIVEFEVYSNGHMCWNEVNEYRSIEGVIAWMPLPEPYKGEET